MARLVSVEGSIERRTEAQSYWEVAYQGTPICAGDFVRTGSYSRGGILIEASDTLVRLDQNTTFQMVAPEQKPRSLLDLIKGAAHFISRIPFSLEVRTPFVNAAVEGTEFLVQADETQGTVVLYEGVVLASNEAGSQRMAPDQVVTAQKGQAPRFSTQIKPRDAVQWTLHYPPLFSALDGDSGRPAEVQLSKAFNAALHLLHKGETQAAFDRLDKVPHAVGFALYHIYRAGLLLAVGRVDEAEQRLGRALKLKGHKAEATALQALVALSKDDKAKAAQLIEQAQALDGKVAVVQLAQSYLHQARFDLDSALDSSRQAVAASPKDAYVHARLAELQLATGQLKEALGSARQAVSIDPEIALAQTVLGFAHLVRIELDEAKQAFNQAASLDQSDPLPRLGQGLALIRAGKLEQGRRELEVATLLDPQNALVRSYMGKAYYEERRDDLAASQYELAKGLDPMDPTPWFYEAILKQQQGQPVDALHYLQTSKALNDNRGVYRSRLTLDADEAARSASLGQVYRDLNFEQLALLEGWDSLAADPTEHSGHRLLADTYAHLTRHEVARVSELLQAQLLQPTNSAPVQPLLAETSIYIPDGVGPSELGFNEYASLFHRDGFRAQISGVLGNDGQAGEEILLSGVEGNVSYGFSQYHYETDGWWENNDQKHDVLLGFVQANLSPDTSVQLEARRSRKDYGDLQMYFYDELYDTNKRTQEELDAIRLGLHHRFNSRSNLIASFIHGESEARNQVLAPDQFVDLRSETDGWWSAEVRQLMELDTFRLTGGLGYTEMDVEDYLIVIMNSPVAPPPFSPAPFVPPGFAAPSMVPPGLPLGVDDTRRQRNAYLYAWVDLTDALSLNLGLSYDDFEAGRYGGFKQDRFNPKLGLRWEITPNTTMRTAAFHTLYRVLPTKQTIEPVDIVGFNQFFDAFPGERVKHLGIALDHRFSSDLSGGAELRQLRRNTLAVESNSQSWHVTKSEEELGRAYLYWTPTKRQALGIEYSYERSVFGGAITNKTHRFPMSLSYFHPSGIGGSLRPTYVRQSGQFKGGMGNDSQEFWNLDLSLDFRFPKRQGKVSLEVRNLLDREFGYEDKDPNFPLFVGGRMGMLRVSLGFQ